MKRLAQENKYEKALDLINANPDKLEDFLEETFINTYGDDYETDVYLYISNNDYEVSTFTNVGGNSWLNDDHICIYTFNERGVGWDFMDAFNSIEDYVNYLIDAYDVDIRLKNFKDEDGNIDWYEVKDYVDDNYPNEVSQCIEDLVQEAWNEYARNQILDEIYDDLRRWAKDEEEEYGYLTDEEFDKLEEEMKNFTPDEMFYKPNKYVL